MRSFRKTLLSGAVLMAMTTTATTAMAGDSKADAVGVASELGVSFVNNVNIIEQTSPDGAFDGNTATIVQTSAESLDGYNGARITQEGEFNQATVYQDSDSSVGIAEAFGNDNTHYIQQTGVGAQSQMTATGDSNSMTVMQHETGGFITHRAVSDVTGDNNTVEITQDQNGQWGYAREVAGSDNTIVIEQVGDNWNEAYVDRLQGDNNSVEISQDGYYNIASVKDMVSSDSSISITQTGDRQRLNVDNLTGDGNVLDIEQHGGGTTGNSLNAEDMAGGDNTIVAVQDGAANSITLAANDEGGNTYQNFQEGDNNESVMESVGTGNDFWVEQVGDSNIAYVGAAGDDNNGAIDQYGNGNEAAIAEFSGSGNTMDILQDGDDNVAVIEMSNGAEATVSDNNDLMMTQEGSMNDMLLTVGFVLDSSGNAVEMSQAGDDNSMDISLEGEDNVLNFSQEGSFNMIGGLSEGDSDSFLVAGYEKTVEINQVGMGNVVGGSLLGIGSSVSITQVGDYNTASVTQN